MGATRLASGIVQLMFSGLCVSFLFIFPTRPEAAKKCPTRDASPPLELEFCPLALSLTRKLGCGSEIKTKVLGLSFCISLALH